jgi:hypothetical protein
MNGSKGMAKCVFLMCSERVDPFYKEQVGTEGLKRTQECEECDHSRNSLIKLKDWEMKFSYAYIYDRDDDGVVASRCIRCDGRVCID